MTATCSGCGGRFDRALLAQARRHAYWTRADGSCPACAQQEILATLIAQGESHFAQSVQAAWPLDPRSLGPLPTPLRLRADPRFLGRGITIAIADSGFIAHPDLIRPDNRVRAWVDATVEPVEVREFARTASPCWPGSDGVASHLWHGTMTSVVAAGNGYLSLGLYRGLAAEAEVVLLHLTDGGGRITDQTLLRALEWVAREGSRFGIRVLNLSVAGDGVSEMIGPIDAMVEQLVDGGVTVVAAAGNDGIRRLIPPATAPSAMTVGGIDDHGGIDHRAAALWQSNFGDSVVGLPKPEVVAPSIWVVAPILPGTDASRRAAELFDRRAQGDDSGLTEIIEQHFVTDGYQHVDGTSFAAPIATSTVAAMLDANPRLTPRLVREAIIRAAWPVPGAAPDRQGAGAIDAGKAVALALRERHRWSGPLPIAPRKTTQGIQFTLHDHQASAVSLHGSWNGWSTPANLEQSSQGLWESAPIPLPPGAYQYKYRLDGTTWLPDPNNPRRQSDGRGGINSVVETP